VLATAIEAAVARPPAPTPAFTPGAAEDDLVVKAIQYIWNHSEHPINVTDVVRQLPITRRSLERRFQNALGRTILEEITNCRLQRAKQLLAATHLPVSQVAMLSGFTRAQHMEEAFQRQEGVSPWAYRRGCRQKDS
jgi:LacI family transcriptional regulator